MMLGHRFSPSQQHHNFAAITFALSKVTMMRSIALFLLLSVLGEDSTVSAFAPTCSSQLYSISASGWGNIPRHQQRRRISALSSLDKNTPSSNSQSSHPPHRNPTTAQFTKNCEEPTSLENDLEHRLRMNTTSVAVNLTSTGNLSTDQNANIKASPEEDEDGGNFLSSVNKYAYMIYLCNVITANLPIVLLPVAASDQLSAIKGGANIAGTVAGVTSIATLGGAVGKFTNGFVCQRWGCYTSSKLYLIGIAICSLAFSLAPNPTVLGWAYAGIEFCASIQWTSLAVMLTDFYARSSPKKLATGLTAIGLASTTGSIAAKMGGAALVSVVDWRIVAQVGSLVALAGSVVASRAPMQPFQREALEKYKEEAAAKPVGSWLNSAKSSGKALVTSKLFLMLSVAHSMAFVNRGIDRILGTFFNDITGLPRGLSGGLTLSTTFGLLIGLMSASKKFATMSLDNQMKFLKKRYVVNVAATFGLATVAGIFRGGGASLPRLAAKGGVAAAVALFSGLLSANIAHQFYQLPTMVSKSFEKHKEVCISWLDGFGFLLSAPVFAATAKIVPKYGWSTAWAMLTVLFAGGWALMLHALPPILAKEKESIMEA